MDNRSSQPQLPIADKLHDQDITNWKTNLKIVAKKNLIVNHKRHMTEPKVAGIHNISIPK